MGLLRGSSMDRSEPALVPEWLRQNHHSSFQSGLTRSSSFSNRSQPPFLFGDRVSERESSSNSSNHRSYPNFGRGRFERSERDREVPVISRGHEWEWSRERSRGYDGGERFGDGGRYKGHGSPRLPPARLEVPVVADKKLPSWPANGGTYERKLGLRSSPLPATPSPGRTTSLLESDSVESHSPLPLPSPSAPAPKMSEALINSTLSQAVSENLRLEEIALKQSRQLIPMKPALPKTMAGKPGLGTSDRLQGVSRDKFKQQAKIVTTLESKSSSPVAAAAAAASASPYRPPPVAPNGGTKQLLVLKSKNSATVCLSTTATTTGSSTSPPGNGSSTPKQGGLGLKPRDGGPEERKPLVLSQNRSDFFNAIRRKAAANGENRNPQENEGEKEGEKEGDESSRKVVVAEVKPAASGGESNGNCHHLHHHHNQQQQQQDHELKPEFAAAAASVFSGSEEEEMNFLKSLGWVESPEEGEDEALTTEEINSFFQKHPLALNQMLRNSSGSSLGSPSSSGSDSDDESRVQSA